MGKRSPEIVSYNMSKIRSKNTKIEILLEEILKKTGIRYEKHYAIFGKPDFAFPELNIALFADSHFWHGYKWAEAKEKIKTNRDFWIPKIERNIQRDQEVNQELERKGWIVLRFWEHEIIKNPIACFEKITEQVKNRKKR